MLGWSLSLSQWVMEAFTLNRRGWREDSATRHFYSSLIGPKFTSHVKPLKAASSKGSDPLSLPPLCVCAHTEEARREDQILQSESHGWL